MNIYEDLRLLRARLFWWRVILVALFLGLTLRFWQLQVGRATTYARLAEANHVRPIPETAPRGLILDRRGRILAENRPSFNLTVDRAGGGGGDTLLTLSRLVEIPEDTWSGPVPPGPAVIKQDIALEEVARIESRQLELPGARIQFVPLRHYPGGSRAAHVLGSVGRVTEEQLEEAAFDGASVDDYVGQSGVESVYNSFLMGRNGVQRVVVNSRGRRERVLEQVPPVWGESVQLSLDYELQSVAEDAFEGKAGGIAVLDPRNGQVLALGSFPSYDPNRFSSQFEEDRWKALSVDPSTPLQNRATQGRYAPGSVFKVVVAAAALEQEVVTPETRMFCKGWVRLYGNVFHCHRAGGHGSVDLEQALAHSCNSYFYQVGAKLQIDVIARYARALGLGRPTGIDLPHEVTGLIPDPEWKRRVRHAPWYAGETISVAVGQGYVLVTALQMAQLAATVGTTGDVHRPQLFLRKLAPGAPPAPSPEGILTTPIRRVELSEETWRTIQGGMRRAVNNGGTAWRARLSGVSVSGKTGTAQVASRGRIAETRDQNRPYELRNHAWFIGFAPSVNPEIALAVVVEHGGGGGQAAAPIAAKVLEAFFAGKRERNRDRSTVVAGH